MTVALFRLVRVGLLGSLVLASAGAWGQTGAPGTPPVTTTFAPTGRPSAVPTVSPPSATAVTPAPHVPLVRPVQIALPGDDKSRALIPPIKPMLSSGFEHGEVLVAWRDEKRFALDYESLTQYRAFEIQRERLVSLNVHMVRYRFPTEVAAAEFREWMAARFPDAQTERNWKYSALGAPRQYAASRLGLPKALSQTPVRVRIGMLDTAVLPISALAGSTLVQRSFTGSEPIAATAHATAVASLMVGRDDTVDFIGPAYGASLYVGSVMRVQRNQSGTTTAMLLAGLDWLLFNKVNIVNLSVGGVGDALLRLAVEHCVHGGIAVVAAAGNGGSTAPPVYPAAYPGVIAVTATDANNAVYDGANRGDYILIAAPGVEVWAPSEVGGTYHTGTSFAAALVSAVLARQLSHHRLSPLQAATRLCSSALDLGAVGRDSQFGCGLLQWMTAR